jgi:hypothetical protein
MATKKATKSKTNFNYKTIKNYEDACKKENHDPKNVPDVSMIDEDLGKAIIGLFKTMIFIKAVNNGWKARMGDSSQVKYYPYAWVLSSGLGFSDAYYAYGDSHTGVRSRLCTDKPEKALYIFEKCKEYYQDWML